MSPFHSIRQHLKQFNELELFLWWYAGTRLLVSFPLWANLEIGGEIYAEIDLVEQWIFWVLAVLTFTLMSAGFQDLWRTGFETARGQAFRAAGLTAALFLMIGLVAQFALGAGLIQVPSIAYAGLVLILILRASKFHDARAPRQLDGTLGSPEEA